MLSECKYRILGKNIFGNIGFTLNSEIINRFGKDASLKKIWKIEDMVLDNSNEKLVMSAHLDKNDVFSLPLIKEYGSLSDNNACIDPSVLVEKSSQLEKINMADFILWDSNKYPSLKVATFSKIDPILLFEAENGMRCFGTLLRKSLYTYNHHIFDRIFSDLRAGDNNKVRITIITCTGKEFENGTVAEYILRILQRRKNITSGLSFLHDVESHEDWLYQEEDIGGHVVVV